MSERPQIVVSGYYGFGNAGDEAVLAGLIDTFRATIPDAALSVASADPDATRLLHGVESFDRYRWQDFRGHMRACDAFVSGGGSLLQDVTSRRSIYYYLGTLALAEFHRRPTMICGQGIGPIEAPAARRVTTCLLNRADLITVREPDSLETLKGLGVSRPPIHVTADPVFALQASPPETARALLAKEGVDLDAPRVLFAMRDWPVGAPTVGSPQSTVGGPQSTVGGPKSAVHGPQSAVADRSGGQEPEVAGVGGSEGPDALVDAVAQAAVFAHRELGAQVLLMPMHPPGDSEFAGRVAERAGVPVVLLAGGYPPRDALALFGQVDLVVAMRLHALIFAAVQGVNLVGISYDPKVEGFLRFLGRTPAADLASIDVEALIQAIGHAWGNREAEAPILREKASRLRDKALENGSLLASLIASRAGS